MTFCLFCRFEQEIAGQLPPPPKLPSFPNFQENSDYSQEHFQGPQIPLFAEHHQDVITEHPTFQNNDFNSMAHARPGLPHLPPLPPLPHGLPLPSSSMSMPDALQMPHNMPQFVPPPLPPVLMNPVQVQSTPVIKPPTVPLDSYDPTEVVEDRSGEVGVFGIDSMKAEKKKSDKKKFVRVGGGTTWEDDTLTDWDASKFVIYSFFRRFLGNHNLNLKLQHTRMLTFVLTGERF